MEPDLTYHSIEDYKFTSGDKVDFTYRNWKGEVAQRKAMVKAFYMGSTQWHPEVGLLMLAQDLEKNEERCFAVKDMKNVKKMES